MKTKYLSHKTNIYLGVPRGSDFVHVTRQYETIATEKIIEHRIIPLHSITSNKAMKLRIPGISNLIDKVRNKLRGKPKDKEEPVIEQVKLKSSNLDLVVYSPDTKIMQVVFKSGGIYHYYNVPNKTFDRLILAPSKGKFFHKEIKLKNFKYDVIR